MAIIEDLGVAVSVLVEGQALDEYHDPGPTVEHDQGGNNENTAMCIKYIEAPDDTSFSLRYEVTNEYQWGYGEGNDRVSFECYIDGEHCRNLGISIQNFKAGKPFGHLRGIHRFDAVSRETSFYELHFSALDIGTRYSQRAEFPAAASLLTQTQLKLRKLAVLSFIWV